MSRSSALFHLQQLDSGLDSAQKRIQQINILLQDSTALDEARKIHQEKESNHADEIKSLKLAEHAVAQQSGKVEQNQKKLYSGIVTNPKELEDLQLEANALGNYLQVLEERQLEAMLAADQSRSELEAAKEKLDQATREWEKTQKSLCEERAGLEAETAVLAEKRSRYLETEDFADLPVYQSLRKTSGGIAVTVMIECSCSSCGSSIPSAIEQAAKSPAKLAFCPTCKRILHPG